MKLDKQNFIRSKAIENQNDPEGQKILWSRHEVETAFVTCEVIEDYPTQHRPLPDCLVLGMLGYSDPLHVVVAIDEVNDRILL